MVAFLFQPKHQIPLGKGSRAYPMAVIIAKALLTYYGASSSDISSFVQDIHTVFEPAVDLAFVYAMARGAS